MSMTSKVSFRAMTRSLRSSLIKQLKHLEDMEAFYDRLLHIESLAVEEWDYDVGHWVLVDQVNTDEYKRLSCKLNLSVRYYRRAVRDYQRIFDTKFSRRADWE